MCKRYKISPDRISGSLFLSLSLSLSLYIYIYIYIKWLILLGEFCNFFS